MAYFNHAITFIMAVFFLVGTVDRLIGGKIGFAKEYNAAFDLMGKVALVLIGLFCISPVLGNILSPVVTPFYHFIGADPAMFGPTFLTIDAGGYSLAQELCDSPEMGKFAGVMISSLSGAAISYTIPLAIVVLGEDDFKKFSVGMMAGIAAGPVGALVAGIIYGFSPVYLLINFLSVFVVAVIIIVGLSVAPKIAMKAFGILARVVAAVIAIGLGAAAFEAITGMVLIPGMRPFSEAASLVGRNIIMIAGGMCLLFALQKVLAKPLSACSKLIGINQESMANLLVSLAIVAAVFPNYKKMDTRGIIVVSAILPTMANVLGAHLAYTASVAEDMIAYLFIGKLVSGLLAVVLALIFAVRVFPEECRKNA